MPDTTQPPALTKWPSAPRSLSPEERVEWKELGKRLLPLGTVSASDLLMVESCAIAIARFNALRKDVTAKPTAVNAAHLLVLNLLRELGLSPRSRKTVCGYRPKPITDSGTCRSPIPVEADH